VAVGEAVIELAIRLLELLLDLGLLLSEEPIHLVEEELSPGSWRHGCERNTCSAGAAVEEYALAHSYEALACLGITEL
jgi:hypothetical protein